MRTSRITGSIGLSCIAIVLVLSTAPVSFAHFVWVESNGVAIPGQEHAISVYFGEYAEFLREEAGGRLDTIDGVTLHVIDPKRVHHDIPLTKKDNHFAGRLPSCIPGRYAVTAHQAEAAVQDLTKHDMGIVKPMFYARTEFVCYAEGRVGERQPEPNVALDLEVIPLSRALNLAHKEVSRKVGSEIVVKVVFKGNPIASRQVLVHSPIGWDKELHTDSQGVASFNPSWPGIYVIEVEYQEKTPGQFKGKSFEAVRHRGTLAVDVLQEGAKEDHHGTK
jgi:uncharacterized GH25 family protein